MINRIPHKVRVPITYLPEAVTCIFMAISLIARKAKFPSMEGKNIIETMKDAIKTAIITKTFSINF